MSLTYRCQLQNRWITLTPSTQAWAVRAVALGCWLGLVFSLSQGVSN